MDSENPIQDSTFSRNQSTKNLHKDSSFIRKKKSKSVKRKKSRKKK